MHDHEQEQGIAQASAQRSEVRKLVWDAPAVRELPVKCSATGGNHQGDGSGTTS